MRKICGSGGGVRQGVGYLLWYAADDDVPQVSHQQVDQRRDRRDGGPLGTIRGHFATDTPLFAHNFDTRKEIQFCVFF